MKVLLFFSFILLSCNSVNDNEILDSALKIVKDFDKSTLTKFCDWGVSPRGNEIWHNEKMNIFYSPKTDTIWFNVIQNKSFNEEFPKHVKFSFDTATYAPVIYKEINNEYLIFRDKVLFYKSDVNKFFIHRNPFAEIKELSEIKNKHNIIMIHNFCKGNLIEFYLSQYHILIYYPNGHNYKKGINPDFEIINNNWILKKQKDPYDFS